MNDPLYSKLNKRNMIKYANIKRAFAQKLPGIVTLLPHGLKLRKQS